MRLMHSTFSEVSIIVQNQRPILAMCSCSICRCGAPDKGAYPMMTQPIQKFQQLTSEACTAGGNDLKKLGFSHDDRRVFEKRARYERAAMLADVLTDALLWVGRQYGRVAGAISENMKLRAAEAQLFRMSDRELSDIGLTRADIAF